MRSRPVKALYDFGTHRGFREHFLRSVKPGFIAASCDLRLTSLRKVKPFPCLQAKNFVLVLCITRRWTWPYAVITIAIRLRYEYDPTTTYRAQFDASKK